MALYDAFYRGRATRLDETHNWQDARGSGDDQALSLTPRPSPHAAQALALTGLRSIILKAPRSLRGAAVVVVRPLER